ncbi:MAG: hypothetical protein HKN79_00460 [Flavobacteriales bacterium]|nr:hypothetical protein [Flavobacteriales bacterium]
MTGKERVVYGLLCLFLFLYIILRSIHVPLVHDEVATYVYYVLSGEWVPWLAHVDANNHTLNSLLSIGFDRLLGTHSWSLRLANGLGFIVLAVYVFKFSRRYSHPVFRWAFILGILGSHYAIEFFALSRGYGLALAFFIGVLYHFEEYLSTRKSAQVWALSVFMLLCLSASLTYLFPCLILGALLVIRATNSSSERRAIIPVLWTILVLIFAVALSFWLKSHGALYYGSEGNFWNRTLSSLGRYLVGDGSVAPYALLGMGLFVFVDLMQYRTHFPLGQAIAARFIHLLLLGSVMGIFLSHYILGTHYPEDRVALYLYPLLIAGFIQAVQELSISQAAKTAVASLLFVLPIHFLLNMNLDHVDFLYRERVPASFFAEIENFESEEGRLPSVSGYHTMTLSYMMSARLDGHSVPAMVHHNYPESDADFILLRADDGLTAPPGHRQVTFDEVSGNSLWREASASRMELLTTREATGQELQSEFYELLRIKVAGEGHYLAELTVEYPDGSPPTPLTVVLNIQNPQKETVAYVPYQMDWRYEQDDPVLRTTLFADGDGQAENELVIYIWNREQVPVKGLDHRLRIFQSSK